MLGSFTGLEMAKRALNAFRLGIEVAGHNITNTMRDGYSRQKVKYSTMPPYTAPGLTRPDIPGQIGTGVKAEEILRIRDEFLDFQYRSQLPNLGYWNKLNQMYETIQLYISEPKAAGVRAAFDTFWGALTNMQKSPADLALRASVVQAAQSLGAKIDSIARGYDDYAALVNSEIKSVVDEANSLLHQVASMSKEIYQVLALGQNPNDLLDKRDLLLDKLSEMALAVGPEGVHQLTVHRLANGEEWTVGGNDPLCLNPDGTLSLNPDGSYIPMRVRPVSTTEELGLASSFRIQVGTQGTQVPSKVFSNTRLGYFQRYGRVVAV